MPTSTAFTKRHKAEPLWTGEGVVYCPLTPPTAGAAYFSLLEWGADGWESGGILAGLYEATYSYGSHGHRQQRLQR